MTAARKSKTGSFKRLLNPAVPDLQPAKTPGDSSPTGAPAAPGSTSGDKPRTPGSSLPAAPDMKKVRLKKRLDEVFTPSTPVAEQKYLQGREEQVRLVWHAIQRTGGHAIIFGDRGVGKTSLAKVAAGQLSERSVYYSACQDDTFETVMATLLRVLNLDQEVARTERKTASQSGTTFGAKVLEASRLSNQEVREMLRPVTTTRLTPQEIARRVHGQRMTFVIDEYDQITDVDSKRLFSELVRNLSNNGSISTLIFVGIGHQVDELLTGHGSLARCVTEIKVPWLSNDDIRAIAVTGFDALGLSYEAEAVDQIVEYSANYPYFTHLLCESSVNAFIMRVSGVSDERTIRRCDVREAVAFTVRTASSVISNQYDDAIKTAPLRLKHVLYAIAQAPFTPLALHEINAYVAALEKKHELDISHNLVKLQEKDLIGKLDRGQYYFLDPLMRAYSILRFRVDTVDHELRTIDTLLRGMNKRLLKARSKEGRPLT
jgi:hypothetical protein